MYTSSSYLDFETALSWPVYKKTRDSIQRVFLWENPNLNCWMQKRGETCAVLWKKKDYIHTTMIHQIKLIISKSGFKDLFIKNSFHSFNLGEWTIQIIKLLGSTFLWYCGTRNLSTLRIFLFFSNSARKFSLFCLFSWWEVTCIGLTFTQNRYSS